MKPFVSIIIPTFNRSKYLLRSIKSVSMQSYQNYELIIVDDLSNDDTEATVCALNNKNVVFVKSRHHLGAASSRNLGIKMAKGSYIAFLDSDDEWLPTKIEKQIKLAELQENDNWLIYTQFYNCIAKIDDYYPKRSIGNDEHISEYLFTNNGIIITSTVFLPSNTIKNVLFNEDCAIQQDAELCLRLYKKKINFIFLHEPLVVWHNDLRSDRVTFKHNFEERLEWLVYNNYLMTDKSIKSYILSRILPITKNLKQRDIALKTLLKISNLNARDFVDIIYCFNRLHFN